MFLSILSCLQHLIVLMILLFFLPLSSAPQIFTVCKNRASTFSLVKINIHASYLLQFSRTWRDTALAESPARICCKTKPRLLDQQWSYRPTGKWGLLQNSSLPQLSERNKIQSTAFSALHLHSCTKPAKIWHDIKYIPARSIGYIYRFCLGWQPSCDLYNSLIHTCLIFLENTSFFFFFCGKL